MISDIVLVAIDANVQQLVDYLGGCERIKKTPLPFVYVVHLRRALILYCFTLPFALVRQLRLVDDPRHAPGRLHVLRHRGDRRRDREPLRPRRQRPAPRTSSARRSTPSSPNCCRIAPVEAVVAAPAPANESTAVPTPDGDSRLASAASVERSGRDGADRRARELRAEARGEGTLQKPSMNAVHSWG